MKKFVLAATALSMVATPVLADTQRGPQRSQPQRTAVVHKPAPTPPRVVVVHKPAPAPQFQARKWQKGQRFDSRYAPRYRQVDYRQHRGMKAPPRGYRYVQSGNDAVLVSITTGIIAAVLLNALR